MYAQYKNETPAAVKTFSPDLRGLISWLETQCGENAYDWNDRFDCLICRFTKANDLWERDYLITCEKLRVLGTEDDFVRVSVHPPHLYSAALSRARSLASQE